MNYLIGSVLAFLGASLLLYVLLAGADFGAGILEIFPGQFQKNEQTKLITEAVAPVWEANHVWLILAVVILFVAFPAVYTALSVYLHIPLLAILVGIVARGCAFTFRHYDTFNRQFYYIYSRIFAFSSLWTSLFLGITVGASILGRINPAAHDFSALYLKPWLNSFSLLVGVFTVCLFAFLAAVYLTGEAQAKELQAVFRRKASFAALGMVVFGFLVFVSAESEGLPLMRKFFGNPLSAFSFIVTNLLWIPFWVLLRKNPKIMRSRGLGAAIVTLALLGWYIIQFPIAIRFSGESLSFYESAAPSSTLRALLIALLVGSLLIFPALGYLFKVFKWESFDKDSTHLF